MAYANLEDLQKLYPESVWKLLGFEAEDGGVDTSPLALALENASSEIDLYLEQRYSTPLENVPSIIKQFTIEIAVYKRSIEQDILTDERRLRYEDIIKTLEKIANGTINLPNQGGSDGSGSDEDDGKNTMELTENSPPRAFTRGKMRGL